MGSSSEGHAKALAAVRGEAHSVVFTKPFTDNAGSVHPRLVFSPVDSEAIEDGDADTSRARTLTRSRSEDVTPRVRERWGTELWNRGPLKESMTLLRASVAEYEKEASLQHWNDLRKINADVADLGKLADEARKTKPRKVDDDERLDGLSKFSTVALEYSKMLDVVMNQSPEYAGLAWGVIRMLLVAHTNHSKLKHAVEEYIIKFGQDFGVVNHLMNSHPTEKMVEAVCEAYAAFSKFLARAVRYYKESKMISAIKAFGFPWETRFQVLVNKIEGAFQRIKDIASASHIGMTAQMHQMVATLGCRQENLGHEMRQNTIELHEKLKFEMRNEVHRLFEEFDRNWISRFEQIMIQSIHGRIAPADSEERKMVSAAKTAAIEYAEAMTETALPTPVTPSASYLADHVGRPKKLKRFRDQAFVHLQKLDRDYIETKVRLRYTTTQDLRQIMSLLRNDRMRDWLLASSPGLIWVNAVKQSGPSDWATAFALRMVEDAAKVENMAVLHHLCGNHPTSSPVSTPAVMLQSLIMQLIEQRHKHFARKDFSFTLEYFRDAQGDIHDLWDLFLKCCAEAKVPGVWLVLDHFDNLARNEDYSFILRALLHVVRDEDRVFKVFFSARTAGTPDELTEVAANNSSVSAITVLKASTSTAAAIVSKQKRAARLPDEPSSEQPVGMASKAEIDALLHSSSEDEQLSDKDSEANENPPQLPVAYDTDLDSSDDSMKFMHDDPFATTDEEDDDESDASLSHPASNAVKPDSNEGYDSGDDDDDDENEDFSFAKRSNRRTPSTSAAADLPADSDTSDDSSDDAHAVTVAGSNSKGQLQSTNSGLRSRYWSV